MNSNGDPISHYKLNRWRKIVMLEIEYIFFVKAYLFG